MKSRHTSALLIALCTCALPFRFAFADESVLQHIDEDDAASALVAEFLSSHLVKRYGIVLVDVQSLRETITEFERPGRQETCCVLKFKLFPDVEIALHTYKVGAEHLEPWFWTGIDSLSGDESVIATLTISFADRITGSFTGPGGRIRIEPLDRRGTHIVWESEPFERRID